MFLWIAAAFAAYFIKGLCGFANALIFNAVLSFRSSNADISPIGLLLGFPANLLMTWEGRHDLELPIWLPLSALVLAGSIPGALLLKHGDPRAVTVFFGAVVIFLGCEMLLRCRSGRSHRLPGPVLVLIGLMGGLLCGLFGVGAPLAAYVGQVTKTSRSFKANICAVFAVDNLFRLGLYGVLELITGETVRTALLLIPVSLAALRLGTLCGQRLGDARVSRFVAALLVLSGVLLILQNI